MAKSQQQQSETPQQPQPRQLVLNPERGIKTSTKNKSLQVNTPGALAVVLKALSAAMSRSTADLNESDRVEAERLLNRLRARGYAKES